MNQEGAAAVPHLGLKVVVRCISFARSRQFYVDVLGLPLLQEWDTPSGQGGMVRFPDGAIVEIYEMRPADPRDQPAFHQPVASDKVELQLRTPSLDPWLARLDGRWPHEGPVTMPWGERRLIVRDPDGLLTSLCEAPEM